MGTPSKLSLGPGLLYWAAATAEGPVDESAALDADFVEVGYTEDGVTFTNATTTEDVEVAEEVDPVFRVETKRDSKIAFTAVEMSSVNLQAALNQGIVSTPPTKISPTALGAGVRISIVHEAESGARWYFAKCYQTGTLTIANQKAPNKRAITCEFSLEVPDVGDTYAIFAAADGRV